MSPYRFAERPFWSIGRPSSASSLAKGANQRGTRRSPTYDGGDAPRPLSEPGISNERLKNWPRRPPGQVRCRDAKPIPFPSPSHSCRSACLTAIPREPRLIRDLAEQCIGPRAAKQAETSGRTCVPARDGLRPLPCPHSRSGRGVLPRSRFAIDFLAAMAVWIVCLVLISTRSKSSHSNRLRYTMTLSDQRPLVPNDSGLWDHDANT